MRELHRDLIEFLHSVGATDVRLEPARRTGHPRIIFTWKGEERTFFTAATPSDAIRGSANARADIRKMLGLVDNEKRVGQRRPRRHRRRDAAVRLPTMTAAPAEDWRMTLARAFGAPL